MIIKQYANSGVDGSSGYEFQKHCALYIFLEQYEEIKDKKYFICLEHYEDFLFCYLTRDELIEKIETYQAKKSSKKWTMTQDFKNIIKKILEVGVDLNNDMNSKNNNYFHNLHFLSNHEISLSKQKDKEKFENIINERNETIKYKELYQEIKDEFLSLTNSKTKNELENLLFKYIDINKTYDKQKKVLVGMFINIFGNKVKDSKASVDTLLSLFRDVENTLNQGNIIALMDKTKRVESEQINTALNIITTQQKAYEEWKSKKDEYSKVLNLHPFKHNQFENAYENAFEYLKDLEQVEHQKIFTFIKENVPDCNNDIECLEKIVAKYKASYSTQFDEITIKAIILASYIQLKEEGLE